MPELSPQPFWSVMIPTYNPTAHLRETLDSVLAQDPGAEQMQVELVDDCSTKSKGEDFVPDEARGRIAFHRNSANLGICGCWNACIERARGQWIHILHQDDVVMPGFYARMREAIERFPEAGAAVCRYALITEDGRTLDLAAPEREATGVIDDALERFFVRNTIQCPAVVVRKATYNAVGCFDAKFSHTLDWEMWLRIAASFQILYEPTVLAAFRIHDQSTTRRQIESGENIRDAADMIRYCRRYLPAESADRLVDEALGVYAGLALKEADWLLRGGQVNASRAQVRAALDCQKSGKIMLRAAGILMRSVLQEVSY